MEKLPRAKFTPEFKHEAVQLVRESGLSISETARRLSIGSSTLHRWVQEAQSGVAKNGKAKREVTEEESQISRLIRENAELRMERDILKKRRRSLPESRVKIRRY